MIQMNLTTRQKESLRARWLQNESDYLRERLRKKVNVNFAFIKLKTIGHGLGGDLLNPTFSTRTLRVSMLFTRNLT